MLSAPLKPPHCVCAAQVGPNRTIDSVSLSFRYAAGYTPSANQSKKAPVVSVVVLDRDSRGVLATLLTTPPLGEYSWDEWAAYSPPVSTHASGLELANDKPVLVGLLVENNERNLQVCAHVHASTRHVPCPGCRLLPPPPACALPVRCTWRRPARAAQPAGPGVCARAPSSRVPLRVRRGAPRRFRSTISATASAVW